MSIEKNIHFVHFGPWPVEPYAAWRQELMRLNPDYSSWLWNEGTIPQLGLNFDDLKAKFLSYAGVSNAVRLHAIYAKGGHYFDSDSEPLKPLDRLDGFLHAQPHGHLAWICDQEPGRACNAALGASKGNPWIKRQIDALPSIERLAAFAGVDLLNNTPRHPGDGVIVNVPHHWFFPWNHDTPPNQQYVFSDTMLIHRWHGSWLPKHS